MTDKMKTLDVLRKEEPARTKTTSHESPSLSPLSRFSQSALSEEDALTLGIEALRSARATITSKEVWALRSMIAYVAYNQKVDETTVHSILLAQMDIETIEDIPTTRYEFALCFLMDIDLSKFLN